MLSERLEAALDGQPSQLGQAASAFEQLQQAGGFPSDATCEALVRRLLKAQRFDSAWSVWRKCQDRQVSFCMNTYQTALAMASKAKKHERVLSIFRALQAAGYTPNLIVYCTAISSMAQSKKAALLRSGRRLWAELCASDLVLDAAAYRIGVNVCVESGDLPAAQGVVGSMRAAGLPADIQAHNILLKGYTKEGRLAQIPRLVADIKNEGLKLNSVSYATLIEAHARAGQLTAAQNWAAAAEMDGVGMEPYVATALLKAHVQAGDLKAGEKQLRRIHTDYRRRKAAVPAMAWGMLLDGYVQAGDLQAARSLLQKMADIGAEMTVTCWNMLLRGYAERGRDGRQGIKWVMERMTKTGCPPDTTTYNTLMGEAVRGNDPKRALGLYDRMCDTGGPQINICDTVTYTIRMKANLKLGQFDEVERLFIELDSKGVATVDRIALNVYVESLSRADRMQEANVMLARADNLAVAEGVGPPVEAHGTVVQGYAARGDLDQASHSLRRFIEAGGRPDLRMYSSIVNAAMRCKDYQLAMQMVRRMEADGYRVDKGRYQDLFTQLSRDEKEGDGTAGRPNEQLERFKFWLGLPNNYYT